MKTSGSTLDSNRLWFDHLSRAQAPSFRLFCFPYAGGSAEVYHAWQRWFPQHIDVCLVHLPGRGRRMKESAFTNIFSLVEELAGRLPPEIKVPYALYGHSMGALISFELARELSRRNCAQPQHLFVSGCRAPHLPRTDPPISHLPEDRFLAELKNLNGTPEEILANPELVAMFIGLLRADFTLVESYKYFPGQRLSCSVSSYGGLQDKDVSAEDCRAWGEQTSMRFKTRMVAGDHFFIRSPVREFIAAFRTDILSCVPITSRLEAKGAFGAQ